MSIGLPSLPIGLTRGGDFAAAQIAAIFAAGAKGLWLRSADAIPVPWWKDSAGTTAITALDDPIGKAIDRSGRGNHLLQATPAARPKWSARVNLLTKSEQFDDVFWTAGKTAGASVTPNTTIAPDGTLTADTVTFSFSYDYLYASTAGVTVSIGDKFTLSIYAKTSVQIVTFGGAGVAGTLAYSFVDAGGGWFRQQVVKTFTAAGSGAVQVLPLGANVGAGSFPIWGAQMESGPVATPYQRVNSLTDYDTGFLQYTKFDGIDDGLGTTFVAGTLTNDTDAFILMRRDTGAAVVPFFWDGTRFFGYMELVGSNSAVRNSGAATSCVVNGVAVPGGAATTGGQLNSAVPVGSFSVLEFRNLDLSAWAQFNVGSFGGYALNGGVAELILLPAQSDTNRAMIRQYLASQAGITV
jgi:hypothetical protein